MSSAGQSLGTRIERSPNVVSRVVVGEAIVVPIRRGAADMDSIYTFNETGSLLWSLIEKGGTTEDLSAQLQSEYGITAEQAADDTAKFVQELKEAGLVEVKPL
jgi:hypothetical protein